MCSIANRRKWVRFPSQPVGTGRGGKKENGREEKEKDRREAKQGERQKKDAKKEARRSGETRR